MSITWLIIFGVISVALITVSIICLVKINNHAEKITETIEITNKTTIFINTDLVQRVYQLDDDVVVEMSNHQEYIILNTNLQVFMDRFKQ